MNLNLNLNSLNLNLNGSQKLNCTELGITIKKLIYGSVVIYVIS